MNAREHCYVCDKVLSLCLCERIASVDNRTAITIVQHPRERRHPFGTARIARLGLGNVAVHVVGREATGLRLPADAALLFPDPGAPVLSAMPAADRPTHLVAIDGTWAHAAQLRRSHPELASLRAVTLAPEGPSRYRIRREPNEQAISTIEAIVRALKVLEPETAGLDALLASFDAMIDDQLERRGEHPQTPRHRHTPRAKKPWPEVFRTDSDDIALVCAELHQPRGQELRFPLRVVAARAHPGPLVDALVNSPIPPSASRVRNMELGPLAFEGALDPATLAEALRGVIRPADTIVAWAQSPGSMLRALGFTQPFLSAKHYYAHPRDGRLGSIDDVVAELGGGPVEPWARGRAGRQIAQLARIVAAMRARSPRSDHG